MVTPQEELDELREEISFLQPLAEEYQLLVENIREYAMIRVDQKNQITRVRASVERIFGYRPEELIGQSGVVLFTPEDIEKGGPEREMATAAREAGQRMNDGTFVRTAAVFGEAA